MGALEELGLKYDTLLIYATTDTFTISSTVASRGDGDMPSRPDGAGLLQRRN